MNLYFSDAVDRYHRYEQSVVMKQPVELFRYKNDTDLDLTEEAPMKKTGHELSFVVSKKPDREYFYKNQLDGFLNSACCRLLIFWSVITTLSSVVSIYYAIDAQNRLEEATDRCVSSIHYFTYTVYT